jgi:hypothetical protein
MSVGAGHLRHDSGERKAGTGQRGWNNYNRTTTTGQLGQEIKDRTIKITEVPELT